MGNRSFGCIEHEDIHEGLTFIDSTFRPVISPLMQCLLIMVHAISWAFFIPLPFALMIRKKHYSYGTFLNKLLSVLLGLYFHMKHAPLIKCYPCNIKTKRAPILHPQIDFLTL
ncbi:hypothetical protein HZS_7639 [Henneguya salminicola]|nr:hypothetical protein HZS_7639 [Henneguya salminicola]